jgi:quercetin dioxygenase-like cupin family protein
MRANQNPIKTPSRKPDFVVGGQENPYMLRWWLIPRNPVFNIYLHQFLRSDDDRALHDHPWFSFSICLQGEMLEHTIRAGGVKAVKRIKAGDVAVRTPWTAHRLELVSDTAMTVFITGPRIRPWGFHCPNGWVPWDRFVDDRDKGQIGRGCE